MTKDAKPIERTTGAEKEDSFTHFAPASHIILWQFNKKLSFEQRHRDQSLKAGRRPPPDHQSAGDQRPVASKLGENISSFLFLSILSLGSKLKENSSSFLFLSILSFG